MSNYLVNTSMNLDFENDARYWCIFARLCNKNALLKEHAVSPTGVAGAIAGAGAGGYYGAKKGLEYGKKIAKPFYDKAIASAKKASEVKYPVADGLDVRAVHVSDPKNVVVNSTRNAPTLIGNVADANAGFEECNKHLLNFHANNMAGSSIALGSGAVGGVGGAVAGGVGGYVAGSALGAGAGAAGAGLSQIANRATPLFSKMTDKTDAVVSNIAKSPTVKGVADVMTGETVPLYGNAQTLKGAYDTLRYGGGNFLQNAVQAGSEIMPKTELGLFKFADGVQNDAKYINTSIQNWQSAFNEADTETRPPVSNALAISKDIDVVASQDVLAKLVVGPVNFSFKHGMNAWTMTVDGRYARRDEIIEFVAQPQVDRFIKQCGKTFERGMSLISGLKGSMRLMTSSQMSLLRNLESNADYIVECMLEPQVQG